VVGVLPLLPAEPIPNTREMAVPHGRRRVYLGTWLDVPVYDLDTLQPGDEVEGPAIFESATTTVLVRRSDRVRVTRHGWLDIHIG
jgi:N-methylhydantoinase A/oxoprolinase/acetone carboxylase beta subunit